MKKSNFKALALMGVAGGMVLAGQPVEAHPSNNGNVYLAGACGGKGGCSGSRSQNSYTADASDTYADEAITTSSKQLTEPELVSQLNTQAKATFQALSPEGQALALRLANQTCKGQNDCKGLNSCKTEKNTCAGFGACKGQSPGPFKDKNDAVKVAAKKMTEKRSSMNTRSNNNR